MGGLDKWLYNFSKRRKVPWLGLTGEYKLVGGASVYILLKDTTNKVAFCVGTTVPTGAGYAKGCIFIKSNASAAKALYENIGTSTVASFTKIGYPEPSVLQVDTVSISKTDILTATTIKTLVAAPATGYYIDYIGASLTCKYATAAYTGGGNLTIGWVGGAAITGILSAANSFGASADKLYSFPPLSTAAYALVKETALGLQTASQFTDPGTAAGTAECTIAYRVLPIET